MADLRTRADVDCVRDGDSVGKFGIGQNIMLRKVLLMSVCFILFALPTTAQQNESEWSVWVTDGETLYRVFLNGDVEEHSLPLPDTYAFEYFPDVADDGIHMARCVIDGESYRVIATDMTQDTVIFDLPLPDDTFNCSVALDEEGNRIAVALARQETLTSGERSTEFIVKVFDVGTQSLITETTDAQLHMYIENGTIAPTIRLFQDNTVIILEPIAAPIVTRVAMWNIRNDEITYGSINQFNKLARLPATGEFVFADEDLTYPSDFCRGWGEGLCPNVIRVRTTSSENSDVIIHHTLYPMFSPIFAANGRYLLIHVYADATNDEMLELYGSRASVPRWIALDRAGRTFELPSEMPPSYEGQPIGTPDGFIFLKRERDMPVQLVYYRLSDSGVSNREVLWETPSTDGRIVWWTELQGDPTLTPFSELSPVISEMPVIVPTATAMPTLEQYRG